jgi:hypothetical protein
MEYIMKNTTKWQAIQRIAGLIALAALIGFSFTACPGDPEEENGLSEVVISVPGGTAGTGAEADPYPLGTTLTAEYTGSENVNYQWKTYPALQKVPGETEPEFTPTEAGRYIVTVSLEGKDSRNSTSVWVAEIFPDYYALFGTWEFDIDHALSDPTGRDTLTQTIVVSADKFRCDDDNGDFFEFSITKWEAATNTGHNPGNLSGSYTREAYQTAFPSGYKLTGSIADKNGSAYDTYDFTRFTSMNVYMHTTESAFVRTANNNIVSCVYVKKTVTP